MPDRDDFVKDPTPLRWPMTLGLMVNDLVIMGIRMVVTKNAVAGKRYALWVR
jgi:hypothetical protein